MSLAAWAGWYVVAAWIVALNWTLYNLPARLRHARETHPDATPAAVVGGVFLGLAAVAMLAPFLILATPAALANLASRWIARRRRPPAPVPLPDLMPPPPPAQWVEASEATIDALERIAGERGKPPDLRHARTLAAEAAGTLRAALAAAGR